MKPIFRKMRALQIFAIAVVTSLSLVSCGGGGSSITPTPTPPTPTPTPTPDAPVTLSVDKVEVLYSAGQTASFTVTCTGSWTITLPSPKPAWLTSVTPQAGTGNATVTITTSENTARNSDQTFLTVKSGSNSKYLTIVKAGKPNSAPTKATNLAPTGSGVGTITEFSWTASTDADNDEITYTAMVSKDNTNWTTVGTTKETKVTNPTELEKNTTYSYKVVSDDGYEGGKTESDVVTFTTGSGKDYWADGEYKLYEVNADGSVTEVSETSRPFKLIFTGDGYTQDLFKYGGQFDQEIDKGIKALFQIEPYKHYYNYFAIWKIAAYSKEAGMSDNGGTGSGPDWSTATHKYDTRFRCTWYGGNSTSISCDRNLVLEVVQTIPNMSTLAAVTGSPISIIINADQYAGTCSWSANEAWGGWQVLSIAMTPARHPSGTGYGTGFESTLRHEYGGHGIGLLGDEYRYPSMAQYNQPYPQANETNFRLWQNFGAYYNIYLPAWDATNSVWTSPDIAQTFVLEKQNWNSFASQSKYADAQINCYAGALMYVSGIYRSEYRSCMVDNIMHFNTVSRWKIYCRIKLTAGETPSLEEFMANDTDVINTYGNGTATKASQPTRMCEGPILEDPYHSKPYRLK